MYRRGKLYYADWYAAGVRHRKSFPTKHAALEYEAGMKASAKVGANPPKAAPLRLRSPGGSSPATARVTKSKQPAPSSPSLVVSKSGTSSRPTSSKLARGSAVKGGHPLPPTSRMPRSVASAITAKPKQVHAVSSKPSRASHGPARVRS